MEEENLGGLFGQLQAYITTRFRLLQFHALDQFTKLLAQIVLIFLLILFGFLVVFLCNIALALFLGEWLGKLYWGILAVAAIDGLLALLLYFFRQTLIVRPLRNSWARMFVEEP